MRDVSKQNMKSSILIPFLSLAIQACSPTRPIQYEYAVLTDSDLASGENGTDSNTSLQKALNSRATEGWRLVSVVSSADRLQAGVTRRAIGGPPTVAEWSIQTHYVYIFERSLANHGK